MFEIIDALPGIELPVKEVTQRLATMWEVSPDSSSSEFRASQMNLVLHFGLNVTFVEARERFDAVIRFAQRYPSRVVVLCPTREDLGDSMTAKLFSQCYIGESHREMCCCEALLLRYKSEDFGYLSNQVSIWLEGDLPTYHWFSCVPAHRVEKYFDNLLAGVHRIVYDSNIEPNDLRRLNWPDPDRVYDLAVVRLLPVRQSIGQFLSNYAIEDLCRGLNAITIKHCSTMKGEALNLMEWVKSRLVDCNKHGFCSTSGPEFLIESCQYNAEYTLSLEWTYDDNRYLRWRKLADGTRGEIRACLGKNEEYIPINIKPLSMEQALAEALFF